MMLRAQYRRALFTAIPLLFLPCAANAQNLTPLARVEALGLDTIRVGRVTAYYAPGDSMRAVQLAGQAEQAAGFFERELGLSFDFRLAALPPEHWFSEYADGQYTIPWYSPKDRLLLVPASGERLPRGGFSRAIDFIALHEYGHMAARQYFHPGSTRDYGPVQWFEELLATYFAYAFIRSFDPEWAEALRPEWAAHVESYTPREVTLDWSFMRNLPPDEFGRTYGWYQTLLNLRVAEIHDKHGVAFLRALRQILPWNELDTWTTASLLPDLEEAAPGFEAWADGLQGQGSSP